MGNIVKHIFWLAPVTMLILYFVIHGQEKVHRNLHQENTEFNRDWNEAQADFAQKKDDERKYKTRAAAEQKELEKALTANKSAEASDSKEIEDFDQAIKSIDQDMAKRQ